MKQTKRIVKGILSITITLLLFVQCQKQSTEKMSDTTNAKSENDKQYLPLAYVEIDSLLVHFNFYNRLSSTYENKVVKHNNSLNSAYQKFQNEVISFQQKVQNNAFSTQERLIQEQARIQRMEDKLKKRATQIEQELAVEQQLIQRKLSDSLILGINEFNIQQKFQIIFAKSGNSILYADTHYNITKEVIEFLNKRFKIEQE